MNYLFTFIYIFMSFILISRSGISIISSLNLIVTIIKKFSLNYDQISLFPWFITAILLIMSSPVLQLQDYSQYYFFF